MNDLSFLRLEPVFSDAKYTRASPIANIYTLGQTVLRTDSIYVQTTNTVSGIAFNGNYQVLIVDCSDNQLLDITSKVVIEEFTDANGIPQINFEIYNIGQDFYAKTVFLKFVHTVSNYVWWSNPINITNYFNKQITRFDYSSATDNLFQSIDLNCYFNVNDAESISSEYTTDSGNKRSSRLIQTEYETYSFDKLDNFTYRRLNNLLSQNVIYINGYRVTNKQILQSKERSGNTNYFKIDFKVAIDYNESYDATFQLFQVINLVGKSPLSYYTLSTLPTSIDGIFNRDITLGFGNLKIYKNGVLFYTFTESDITVVNNTFSIDITGLISLNDTYSIQIDSGLFISTIGEIYGGIQNNTDWSFTLSNADFDSDDFSNDFII